jgi:leucyl-tRNA synthetase
VIAPEHPLLKKLVEGTDREKEVLDYAKKMISEKAKLGEDYVNKIDGIFTGRYVWYEPAKRELPIWVASFAVVGYGTGIVNCSFHDERDFAFAKKFDIPLHPVTEPLFIKKDGYDAFRENEKIVERDAVVCIIKHWKEDKFLGSSRDNNEWNGFVIGGIETGENIENTAIREVREETGYKNVRFIKKLPRFHSKFYQSVKKENRFAHFQPVYLELVDGEQEEISAEEKSLHKIKWIPKNEVSSFLDREGSKYIWDIFLGIEKPIIKNGILTEPKEFAGREWGEVREDIIDYIMKRGWGERKTNYKMRDAIFARQRYWGEPIPLMHDKDGLITELLENKLPLKLPPVKSYKPTGTGESPLANVKDWVKKGYETNTMPGWAGSSWYFLRYMDPKNKKAFANKDNIKYWKNVDMYVGGAEHATGHLLYSRFWHKFLKDYGLVVTEEPFQTLRNQGMILGMDNRKMSKRWGNVINPDEVVKNFGADTLRLYEMFMGPFESSLPWSTDNIVGVRRFLERVWKIGLQVASPDAFARVLGGSHQTSSQKHAGSATHGSSNSSLAALETLLHKTIKKVGEDIETFSFNTTVSSMMILLNEMEKQPEISKENFEIFLKILCPFAPHITEELWQNFGHKTLLVNEVWPKFNPKKLEESEIKIIVQVNGKVRAEIFAQKDELEDTVKHRVFDNESVKRHLEGKTVKKIIYIKNRLINMVV